MTWHAYAPAGAPAGAPVVWAARVDLAVSVQPQDSGRPFVMDGACFDRLFRPTADQTSNRKDTQ